MTPGRAPLPTLRDRRKQEERDRRLTVDAAVQSHLDAAHSQVLSASSGGKDEAIRSLCVAVESAYGIGKMPEPMWRTIDAIVEAVR